MAWGHGRRCGRMGEVSGSDRLRDAVAELYAGDPDEFVARRSELAAQAKSAGDGAAAKQIAGLRKPTRSAWVVNQLARAQPAAVGQLAELGAELRAAQEALNGGAIRQLSQQRRELIDALARDAFTAAGERSPSASVREEVVTTLSAALVDPDVAEQMRAGALERVVSRDGLGGDPGAAGELAAWAAAGPGAGGTRAGASRAGGSRSGGASAGASRSGSGSTVIPLRPRTARASPAGAGSASSGGGRAAQPSAKVTRLAAARAKAERAKAERERAERERRRKAIIAAEQAVARADRAQRSTARTEQAQENTISLLESELAEARQKLTEARLQARRARTAQRQARRALDKLRDAPED
jgi:hypothetical protein